MKYEIRRGSTVLFSAEAASLHDVVEQACRSGADLSGADLYGAHLYGASGVSRYRSTPLLMLLDQPGKIRAYKLVAANGQSPIQSTGRITYTIGSSYEEAQANADETVQCGAGINLATLPWCMSNWQSGWRILIAEFEACDIAAIPIATDGKFRVRKCTIVGEKDLREIGLVKEAVAVTA